MTITQKLALVAEDERLMRIAVARALAGQGTWGDALHAVFDLERATKAVRAVVRKNNTKFVREHCDHPQDRRFTYLGGSSRCKACGLNFKAPKAVTA